MVLFLDVSVIVQSDLNGFSAEVYRLLYLVNPPKETSS